MADTAETLELNTDGSVEIGAGAESTALADDATGTAANGVQPGAEDLSTDGASGEGGDEDEFAFQFGDEAPPTSTSQEQQDAPQWVKDLRKQHTQLQRENRELQAKLQGQQPQETAVPTLGAKPKLENFDYDEGKFDEAIGKWYADKAKVDAAQAEQRKDAEARQRALDERSLAYRRGAESLKVKNFKELEDAVVVALSPEQQGILLAGADNAHLLVAALGTYPTKLKTLAQIKDPVRFAFAAAKLEKELKVSNRTANKPAPEGRVSSSSGAPAAGGGEKKLEQLRAEAEKTGDYTKVVAYKRQLKQAQERK